MHRIFSAIWCFFQSYFDLILLFDSLFSCLYLGIYSSVLLYFGIKSLSCFMVWYICMLKCAIIICFICTFNIMEKTALVHWQEIKYSYFYIFLGIKLWEFPYGLRYPRKFCDFIIGLQYLVPVGCKCIRSAFRYLCQSNGY